MLLGYARVSTPEQNPDHQTDALHRAGVAPTDVYLDHASGAKASRPQLDQVLRNLREGDTLIITRLDRLGRSVLHLVTLGASLRERGIGLKVLEQGIDTSTAEGRAMFGMLSVLAELQRELIVANTRDGLAAARARGRTGGRRPKLSPHKHVMPKSFTTHAITPFNRSPTYSACPARPSTDTSIRHQSANVPPPALGRRPPLNAGSCTATAQTPSTATKVPAPKDQTRRPQGSYPVIARLVLADGSEEWRPGNASRWTATAVLASWQQQPGDSRSVVHAWLPLADVTRVTAGPPLTNGCSVVQPRAHAPRSCGSDEPGNPLDVATQDCNRCGQVAVAGFLHAFGHPLPDQRRGSQVRSGRRGSHRFVGGGRKAYREHREGCRLSRFLLRSGLLFVDVFGCGRSQLLVDLSVSSRRHRVPPGKCAAPRRLSSMP